jgi:hypothetical protein
MTDALKRWRDGELCDVVVHRIRDRGERSVKRARWASDPERARAVGEAYIRAADALASLTEPASGCPRCQRAYRFQEEIDARLCAVCASELGTAKPVEPPSADVEQRARAMTERICEAADGPSSRRLNPGRVYDLLLAALHDAAQQARERRDREWRQKLDPIKSVPGLYLIEEPLPTYTEPPESKT